MKNALVPDSIGDPLYPARSHVFVDETKARGYYVVASICCSGDVAQARAALKKHCRAGQRRVHFNHENDTVRRAFLQEIRNLGLTAVVYTSREKDLIARKLCLTAMIEDLHQDGASRLTLEMDDGNLKYDRILIGNLTRGRRGPEEFTYLHVRPHEEPLLWVSDAIAWCIQRGGEWAGMANDLVKARKSL